MVKLLITYKDYIHCTVHGLLSADLSACVKEFKVFIPSARFQASYKLGRWMVINNILRLLVKLM